MTWEGFLLEQVEPGFTVGLGLQDESAYRPEEVRVTGTVSGAPVDSYVLFYGEAAYHGYVYVSDEEPVEFDFTADTADGSYQYSAVALNLDNEVPGVALATWEGEAMDLALDDELAQLEVLTDRPLVDGEPLQEIDQEWCASLGMVTPASSSYAVTGWASSCEVTDDGFRVLVDYPPGGGVDRVGVYVTDDVEARPLAWASAPVPADGVVTLDVLDTPLLGVTGAFEPGGAITWDEVPDADQQTVTVLDGDAFAWYLVDQDGGGVAWPELPEEVAALVAPAGGEWAARAQRTTVDEATGEPVYAISLAPGGEVIP